MFHKLLDYAEAGDNIGALLRGIAKTDIERGQVLAKPGSIHPHTKFTGQVYVLTKEEGGRHTPFFNNYRPCLLYTSKPVTVPTQDMVIGFYYLTMIKGGEPGCPTVEKDAQGNEYTCLLYTSRCV